MTITYTQQDKIITDALEAIFKAEFPGMEIVIDDTFDSKYIGKGEYLRIFIVDIVELSKASNGAYYDYSVQMVWYFNKKKHDKEDMQEKIISPRIQNALQLLNNNRVYQNGGSGGWHNLTVEAIPKIQTVEEIDELEGNESFVGTVIDATIQKGVFW